MESLLTFALLACPIGMGLMMWFMSKGMRGGDSHEEGVHGDQASLAELQAQHAHLGAEIDRLESRDGWPDRVVDAQR